MLKKFEKQICFIIVITMFFVGILQYLFYYQSAECKEDGQLLLCRSVAVKYIHQKDGEK